jgi:hypothetical protein
MAKATAALIDAIPFLGMLIRYVSKQNTETCLDYATSPEPYTTLTLKQWVSVHNAAVSLLNAGRAVDLGSRKNKREPGDEDRALMRASWPALATAANEAKKAGTRFTWVHQRYTPLIRPTDKANGVKRRSLSELWTDAKEGSEYQPLKADKEAVAILLPETVAVGATLTFVQVCKVAAARKAIEQRPAYGGFMLALAEDAEANRKAGKDKPKPKSTRSVMDELNS